MNSIITKHDYTVELLEDIINQTPLQPADLIICSSRDDFLQQLLAELEHHSAREESKATEDEETSHRPHHILLSNTLHVLSASQHVRLIFCPTLTTLRSYLSGYTAESTISFQALGRLIILNLLAQHHGTSEFTLQGLSQTFATAVSAAHRTRRPLKLVECKDIRDPTNLNRGSALWWAEVQLLSAAIKLGETGQNWGRRTISVERIASRWFRIEESAQKPLERQGSIRPMPDDEMLL
jgi:hypothetical protein